MQEPQVVHVELLRFVQHPLRSDDVGRFTTDGWYYFDNHSGEACGPYASRVWAFIAKQHATGDEPNMRATDVMEYVLACTNAQSAILSIMDPLTGEDVIVSATRPSTAKISETAERWTRQAKAATTIARHLRAVAKTLRQMDRKPKLKLVR